MDPPPFDQEEDDHASIVLANQILRSATGAVSHGAGIAVLDMKIQTGIYVDPHSGTFRRPRHRRELITHIRPEEAGLPRPEVLSRRIATFTLSPPEDAGRLRKLSATRPQDQVILSLYSLHRYLEMSTRGNPRMLLPLFAPEESLIVIAELGRELRDMRASILSVQTVKQFLGYLEHALSFLHDGSERSAPDVAEQVAAYGWDVGSGGRALCLAYQAREIATTAHLTLPPPAEQRRRLLAINQGLVPRDDVSAEISECQMDTLALVEGGRTPLPWRPPVNAIMTWAADAEARYRPGDAQAT
jgi:uncharacterized protein